MQYKFVDQYKIVGQGLMEQFCLSWEHLKYVPMFWKLPYTKEDCQKEEKQ